MAFNKLSRLLADPIIKQGIAIASPQAALILGVLESLGGAFGKKPSARILLDIIDRRLASITTKLANEKTSDLHRKELEIRLHEILGILNEWEKRT